MSTKAPAARIYEYGEPDVFRFETMDVPDPVGHEVLVRNTVIGLIFVDIYYRRGTLPVPEFPAIILKNGLYDLPMSHRCQCVPKRHFECSIKRFTRVHSALRMSSLSLNSKADARA